jgi:hypothetical protein
LSRKADAALGPTLRAAFDNKTLTYNRAVNGALVTQMRDAVGFMAKAIKAGGQVAVVSEEEGEAVGPSRYCPHVVERILNPPLWI